MPPAPGAPPAFARTRVTEFASSTPTDRPPPSQPHQSSVPALLASSITAVEGASAARRSRRGPQEAERPATCGRGRRLRTRVDRAAAVHSDGRDAKQPLSRVANYEARQIAVHCPTFGTCRGVPQSARQILAATDRPCDATAEGHSRLEDPVAARCALLVGSPHRLARVRLKTKPTPIAMSP